MNKMDKVVNGVIERICRAMEISDRVFKLDNLKRCLVAACCASEISAEAFMPVEPNSNSGVGSRFRQDLAELGLQYESDTRRFFDPMETEALVLGLMPNELSLNLEFTVVHQLSNDPCAVLRSLWTEMCRIRLGVFETAAKVGTMVREELMSQYQKSWSLEDLAEAMDGGFKMNTGYAECFVERNGFIDFRAYRDENLGGAESVVDYEQQGLVLRRPRHYQLLSDRIAVAKQRIEVHKDFAANVVEASRL